MNQYDIILHQADNNDDFNTKIINLSNSNSKLHLMYADYEGVPRILTSAEYVDSTRDYLLFDIDIWTHKDSSNVRLGYMSGMDNSAAGTGNTNIGMYAGGDIASGSGNICLGYMAGRGIVTAHNNIIIGSGDYPLHQSVGYSIAIGKARPNTSRRLVIDSDNTESPLIYGEFDNDFLRINGKTEANGDLEVINDLILTGIELGTISALLCRDGDNIVRDVEPSSPILNIPETGTGAEDLQARQKINAILAVLRAKKIINT